MKYFAKRFIKSVGIFILFSTLLCGQEVDTTNVLEGAPKIFIDAHGIDMDYVRREVQFVNYVNDPQQADIFVLVTTNRTGSRGVEYTLTFIGRNQFESMNDTIVYNSLSTDTDDNIRSGFVKTLKMGLIPYMLDTPLVNMFDVKFNSTMNTNRIKDKWDYWIFRTRLRGSISDEEFRNFYYISCELDADRITEEWKLRFGAGINYDEDKYTYEDEDDYISFTRRWSARAQVVKSLSDHWSLGGYARFLSSTYRNIKRNFRIGPAIEYNIFPYSESTYREMRFSYSLSYSYNNYFDETIYGKMEEALFRQSFEIDTEFKQPWGDIEISAEYSNYMNDFSKNRIQLWADLSINIFEGFAINFGGGYSMIHNQIYLPARDLSLDEVLLQRSELATQYNFGIHYGFSYTFGSIYNNIVNPRFD